MGFSRYLQLQCWFDFHRQISSHRGKMVYPGLSGSISVLCERLLVRQDMLQHGIKIVLSPPDVDLERQIFSNPCRGFKLNEQIDIVWMFCDLFRHSAQRLFQGESQRYTVKVDLVGADFVKQSGDPGEIDDISIQGIPQTAI